MEGHLEKQENLEYDRMISLKNRAGTNTVT
jgi:hypothetical protein